MSVKLYIRDNIAGRVHEYGTNSHDSLILNEDGSLHYHNLQNGTGTAFPDEGYTFCLSDGTDPRTDETVRMYGVEPFLNIGGEREKSAEDESFKMLFSRFCRKEIAHGACQEDDCSFCPINRAYEMIFPAEEDCGESEGYEDN